MATHNNRHAVPTDPAPTVLRQIAPATVSTPCRPHSHMPHQSNLSKPVWLAQCAALAATCCDHSCLLSMVLGIP